MNDTGRFATRRKSLPGQAAIAAVAAALVASAAAPGSAEAETLVFGNSNPRGLNIGMAPIHYALEKGYFEEEGLEIEFVNFSGSGLVYPQVANKAVDIGWVNPDLLIKSHQPGQDAFPVVAFYNHLRSYVWEIVVPADSEIQSVADLKGKTLGVNSLVTGNIPTTKAILTNAGLDPEADVSMLPVGMGGSAFLAMREGQIDALNLFDTMHAMLENTGFDIRRLSVPEKYNNLFANVFITHRDNLTERREQIAGFGRAMAKGTVGCYADLEACVRVAWQNDPAMKPQEGSEEKHLQDAVNLLETRGAAYQAFPGEATGNWGSFPDQGWENFVAVLHESGELSTDEIDVAPLYTNDLVPEMNDFDSEALEAEARQQQ